ncbi:putative MFS family arabinose efflux permease [Mucilaginibacter frigoritolerans]|jgi:MFS family permease|uniref:Putative MFS family arabinose efflux permease n=1 Tax=Mucilaginibacter frigoritolerans TaxID=652788 RepID=A0A562TYI9_9SPHI|nr:MFS transporter [Mucilaginibacter frigoritolerans]TWI98184.1 putative MFS family arabinose efflux permease [Mucilaginibacter frigoritolerans]
MAVTSKPSTFRAFRNRNYTLYFTGQGVSLIGTWMQRTGVSWVVYTLTHSPLMLGVTVFASQFPSFLFSLLGGIVSDRYNRYKVLLVTQAASMVQAILLAVLTLTHHFVVWEILTLSVILGIINAFDVPARQPLVHELVNDPVDLPNALAFNSSMNNIARLVGPALSGIVLVKFGAGICFLFNAFSFLAVLISLLLMKLKPYVPSPIKKKIQSDLKEGFTYLKNTREIAMVLLMLSFLSLLVLPYNTLLPVFAKVIFKGNAATYGYINSFIGLGAVVGAIFLASIKPEKSLKRVLLINTIIFGFCLMLFARIGYFPVAMLFATLGGFAMMTQTTICITLIQVNSDKNMRGRVMSFMAMAYFGMLPLGSLLIGAVSQKIGAPATMFCQGMVSLCIAAIFFNFLIKKKPPIKVPETLLEEELLNN